MFLNFFSKYITTKKIILFTNTIKVYFNSFIVDNIKLDINIRWQIIYVSPYISSWNQTYIENTINLSSITSAFDNIVSINLTQDADNYCNLIVTDNVIYKDIANIALDGIPQCRNLTYNFNTTRKWNKNDYFKFYSYDFSSSPSFVSLNYKIVISLESK